MRFSKEEVVPGIPYLGIVNLIDFNVKNDRFCILMFLWFKVN